MAVTGIKAEVLAVACPALPLAGPWLVHSPESPLLSVSSALGPRWMSWGDGEVKETGSLA